MAALPGNVHGVVVQIRANTEFVETFLISIGKLDEHNSNLTVTDLLIWLGLYSNSASANALLIN